ncbi:hypothetical protein NMG60_11012924 [Bertholletia excelsa]
MEEEFQESEVIFPESVEILEKEDDNFVVGCGFPGHSNNSQVSRNNRTKKKKKKKISSSVPVNIPENLSRNSWYKCGESELFDENGDGEFLPPHVIVGRRMLAGKVAFSLCSGSGRTLKGRDLSEVRNSILRMTGFLET